MVADWLDLASAIKNVSVDFNYYDDTNYCGTAYDYNKFKSIKLSSISTSLSTFQYIWFAFELLCKCLPIKPLPKKLKNGRVSFVDCAQFYIKNNFDERSSDRIFFYTETLRNLHIEVKKLSHHNLGDLFYENYYTSQSGIGIQVVRSIRNIFAHGATFVQEHEDYTFDQHLDESIIDISSRIVLFTIQALLLSYSFVSYQENYEFVDLDYPFGDGVEWENLYALSAENIKEANQAFQTFRYTQNGPA